MSSEEKHRSRMTAEQRREQILVTATRLFADKGFEATTTRDIAREAGINEALIYKHFAGKEDLYDAVFMHVINILKERTSYQHMQESESLEEGIQRIASNVIAYSDKDQTFIRLLFFSVLQDHKFAERFVNQFAGKLLELIAERIQKMKEEGLIDEQVDVNMVSLGTIGAIAFFNIGRNLFGFHPFTSINPEEYIRQVATAMMSGIKNTQEDSRENN